MGEIRRQAGAPGGALTVRLFLKNLLFTVLVPGTVAGWVPWRIAARGGHVLAGGWMLAAGAVLAATGVAIALWCVRDFAVAGRGTPAPFDPPTQLVVRGLYRYVRNPMYVGVLSVIAGWSLLYRSAAVAEYGAIVWLLFTVFVVAVEEPMLKRRFGASYEAYCRSAGRWLPRVAGDGSRTDSNRSDS